MYVLLKPLRALVTVNDAVLLRRHLDPIGGAVVDGRRRRAGAGRRRGHRRHRHRLWLIVDRIGDEQAGHGVFLAAQRREVHLPEILEARRRVNDPHRGGCPPLRVPLFMIATRDCSACTSTSAFEIGWP